MRMRKESNEKANVRVLAVSAEGQARARSEDGEKDGPAPFCGMAYDTVESKPVCRDVLEARQLGRE